MKKKQTDGVYVYRVIANGVVCGYCDLKDEAVKRLENHPYAMEQIIIELPHGMTAENLKDNPEAVAGLLRQIALAIENYERNVNWNMSNAVLI